MSYLEAGQVAAKAVGRVIIRDGRGRSQGFGTGFLVGPRLMLTNNHVLTSLDVARASQIEFNYQRALDGHVGPTTIFALDPEAFFVTSPIQELDFTLVAVSPISSDGKPLEPFGYHPLTAVADEVLAGECVTIIQHPKGDPKQIALRKNEVLRLPNDEDRFLHYQTDTTPGSSGSPVFNDGWEVVALHHSGKPAVDEQGKFLADDGSLWKPEMGLDRVKWLANEGIRVAAIVDFIQKQALTDAQKALLAPSLDPTPRPNKPNAAALRADPVPAVESEPMKLPGVGPSMMVGPNVLLSHSPERPGDATPPGAPLATPTPTAAPPTSAVATAMVAADGSVVVTIPLQITARLMGSPTFATAPIGGTEEAVRIDPNYSNREGYDPEFLGAGDLAVPLPKMSKAMMASAAVNRLAQEGAPSYELPYHHFSVAFHRKRRLAYFTAVNIDGRTPLREKREADKWSYDPRIDQEAQVGNDFYAGTLFDRGHLVRRLDPAWGRSEGVAKAANDDTFHFTNCSPQHKRFNEGKNLWAGLEDYLLDRAGDERRRMTVFTGPVFAKGDQEYRELPIPKRYWKVAVLPSKRGGLVATAFVVSQEDLLRPLFEATPRGSNDGGGRAAVPGAGAQGRGADRTGLRSEAPRPRSGPAACRCSRPRKRVNGSSTTTGRSSSGLDVRRTDVPEGLVTLDGSCTRRGWRRGTRLGEHGASGVGVGDLRVVQLYERRALDRGVGLARHREGDQCRLEWRQARIERGVLEVRALQGMLDFAAARADHQADAGDGSRVGGVRERGRRHRRLGCSTGRGGDPLERCPRAAGQSAHDTQV